MDLYYNGTKISSLAIVPTTTIRELKQTISNWLVPQGVTNYAIKVLFNDGSEVAKEVFATNTYDMVNFQIPANLLAGGQIHVYPAVPSPQEPPAKGHLLKRTEHVSQYKEKVIIVPEFTNVKSLSNKYLLDVLGGLYPIGFENKPKKADIINPNGPKIAWLNDAITRGTFMLPDSQDRIIGLTDNNTIFCHEVPVPHYISRTYQPGQNPWYPTTPEKWIESNKIVCSQLNGRQLYTNFGETILTIRHYVLWGDQKHSVLVFYLTDHNNLYVMNTYDYLVQVLNPIVGIEEAVRGKEYTSPREPKEDIVVRAVNQNGQIYEVQVRLLKPNSKVTFTAAGELMFAQGRPRPFSYVPGGAVKDANGIEVARYTNGRIIKKGSHGRLTRLHGDNLIHRISGSTVGKGVIDMGGKSRFLITEDK